MNHWNGTGRFTKDPDIRHSQGNNPTVVARFTIACDRRFAKEGQDKADFINCVAFGKTAEFIEKYFCKGKKAEIDGRIQTGSYEKDGRKIYTTDIVVEEIGFAESKAASGEKKEEDEDGFVNVPEGIDTEMPFV
jgi:single-strand DNA-binding protein